MRGFSEANGSWNTICMRRRSLRSGSPRKSVMSMPSKRIVPRGRIDQPQHEPRGGGFAAAGFANQRQRLAAVSVNEMPSTARTTPTVLPNTKPR